MKAFTTLHNNPKKMKKRMMRDDNGGDGEKIGGRFGMVRMTDVRQNNKSSR